MVDFNGFAFRQVPADVADALGQQKKKLFESNAKLDVQEMITYSIIPLHILLSACFPS